MTSGTDVTDDDVFFTAAEAAVVAKYAEHVGCNCGDNQCHEDGEAELLRSAAAKIAMRVSSGIQ